MSIIICDSGSLLLFKSFPVSNPNFFFHLWILLSGFCIQVHAKPMVAA